MLPAPTTDIGGRHASALEVARAALIPRWVGRPIESGVVIDERSAHSVEQKNIVVSRKEGFTARVHSDALLSPVASRPMTKRGGRVACSGVPGDPLVAVKVIGKLSSDASRFGDRVAGTP